MSYKTEILENVAEVAAGGGAPQSEDSFSERGTPFVRAGSLPLLLNGVREEKLELLTDETARKHKLRLFPTGTILFAKSGMSATKGHIYQLKNPCYVVNHLAAIIPTEQLSSSFLKYWLQVYRPSRLIQDEAYPSIRLSDIRNIQIPLPPISEQHRIAEVLDKAESLRDKRRFTLQQLDPLLQSVFLEMFGDPVKNPRGFQTVKFSDVCLKIFKGAFDLKQSMYMNAGIPFIRITNIQNNTIDLKDCVYISESTHNKYIGSQLMSGDIVFSKVGTIDRIGLIPSSIPFCNISQNNVGAILNKDIVEPIFALTYLTLPSSLNKIRAGSKKAVQEKLVLSELRNLPFILPKIELQQRFVSVARRVKALTVNAEKSFEIIGHLFQALQQRAFKGELFDDRTLTETPHEGKIWQLTSPS